MATKKKTATKKASTKKTATKNASKSMQTMRTFAIRVTTEELEAIHKASGPRNASRFMRAVAAAFANADEAAFKAALKDAADSREATR